MLSTVFTYSIARGTCVTSPLKLGGHLAICPVTVLLLSNVDVVRNLVKTTYKINRPIITMMPTLMRALVIFISFEQA